MAVINAKNDTFASSGILDVVELVFLNGLYFMGSTLLGLLRETGHVSNRGLRPRRRNGGRFSRCSLFPQKWVQILAPPLPWSAASHKLLCTSLFFHKMRIIVVSTR